MENIRFVSRRKASEREAANAIESFLERKRERGVELTRKLQQTGFAAGSMEVKLSAEKEMALSMCLAAIREHLEENLAAADYDSSDEEEEGKEEQAVETRLFQTHSERRRVQAMQKREERFAKTAPKQMPAKKPAEEGAATTASGAARKAKKPATSSSSSSSSKKRESKQDSTKTKKQKVDPNA